MADTRLITIVAGNQYYLSDPSIVSTQSPNIHYLDMSDADTFNPTYSTFSNFGNIKTGFYDSYDVKLNINFKSQSLTSPELDAKEQRAAFVSDVVPNISQILVFPTGITGNAFSKSAKVKTVEMVDNSFVDGLQLAMVLELVGRWITPFSDLTTDTLTKLHVKQGDTHSDTLYLKDGTYTWEGTITNGADSSPEFGDDSPLDMDNPFVFKVVNSNTQAVLQSQQVYNGAFSLTFSAPQAGFYQLIIDNKYNNDTENYWDSSDHTGGYYASNGYLTPPSSKAEISTVNYYAIDPAQPTTVACWATVPANDSQWLGVVFYDVNKNVIARKAYAAYTQTSTTKNYLYKVNFLKAGSSGYNAIPAGAASLRVSFRTWGSNYHLKIAINQADIVKFTPSPFEASYYVPYDLDFSLMGSSNNLPAPINSPNSVAPSDNVNIYPAKILPSNTNKWALVLSSPTNVAYTQLTFSNGSDTADLTITSPTNTGNIILTSDLLETKLQPLVIASKKINYVSASAVGVTSVNSTDMAAVLNMITNSQGTTTVTASNIVTGELVPIGFYEYDVKDFI